MKKYPHKSRGSIYLYLGVALGYEGGEKRSNLPLKERVSLLESYGFGKEEAKEFIKEAEKCKKDYDKKNLPKSS